MITDQIGRHKVLLPINQNNDKILERRRVHCPIGAQLGRMITNHIPEFCYSCD